MKLEEEVEQFLERISPYDYIPVECLYRAISIMEGKKNKPGLDLLSEKRRKSYKTDLKAKFESKIGEITEDASLSKREIRALMTSHLLNLAIEARKSEFDLLVTIRVRGRNTKHILYIFLSRTSLLSSNWRSKHILRGLERCR